MAFIGEDITGVVAHVILPKIRNIRDKKTAFDLAVEIRVFYAWLSGIITTETRNEVDEAMSSLELGGSDNAMQWIEKVFEPVMRDRNVVTHMQRGGVTKQVSIKPDRDTQEVKHASQS